jgi:hypothetical protein
VLPREDDEVIDGKGERANGTHDFEDGDVGGEENVLACGGSHWCVTRHTSHVTCDGHRAHDASAQEPIPKHRLQLVPDFKCYIFIEQIATGAGRLQGAFAGC